MNDFTSPEGTQPIDTKRPWITDPREALSEMNWLQSYTNPLGETSRLHFTRGWTGLFFLRLIWYVGFALLAAVFGAAGVEDPSALVPPGWVFLVLIVLTALASIVLHIRRLGDAKRSPLWAVLVAIPALAMLAGLMLGSMSSLREYSQAERAAALEQGGMPRKLVAVELDRPDAADLFARELLARVELGQLERGVIAPDGPMGEIDGDVALSSPDFATALADISTEVSDSQRSKIQDALDDIVRERADEEPGDAEQGGNLTKEQRLRQQLGRFQREWSGKLPQIDSSRISQRDFAMQSGVGLALGLWTLPAFFVMLWSLLWVGRLPTGGGKIKDRFDPSGT
ncbi:MAG: DUF805 domain-containing protein [Pseudomonadota bacterium]